MMMLKPPYWSRKALPSGHFPRSVWQVVRHGLGVELGVGRMRLEKGLPGYKAIVVTCWAGNG